MLSSCGKLAEERADPVGIRMEQRILMIFIESNVFSRESRNVSGPCDTGVILARLVIQFSILGTVQIAWQGRRLLEGKIAGITDVRRADITLSRRDENYTIRALYTVNCCCRGIFQDVQRFDFIRINAVEIGSLHTVHHD